MKRDICYCKFLEVNCNVVLNRISDSRGNIFLILCVKSIPDVKVIPITCLALSEVRLGQWFLEDLHWANLA